MNQTRNWFPVFFLVCLGVVGVSPIPSLAATTIAITTDPQPNSHQVFQSGADLRLHADVIPDEGRTISKVEFFHDATPIGGEVTAAPYEATWEKVSAGTYALVVKATDDNNVETSESVSIDVKDSPSVTISPADKADLVLNYPGSQEFTATVTAAPGASVDTVEFVLNGETQSTLTSPPYTYSATNLPVGFHTLSVNVTDSLGLKNMSYMRIIVLAGMTVSVGDCTDAAIAAATPRKILYLGDSLTDNSAVGSIEAHWGANTNVTASIAMGGHTTDGTSPWDTYTQEPARPYLVWKDGTPNARLLKPTKWQYVLEPRDPSKYPGYANYFSQVDTSDPQTTQIKHIGHSLEEYDGVVVPLGTNDGMFLEEGNAQIPTNQWISDHIETLLAWLQPSANRPVIWVLPHFTQFPNSWVPDAGYNSTNPHTCFSAVGIADPAYCKDITSLDDIPDSTPMPPIRDADKEYECQYEDEYHVTQTIKLGDIPNAGIFKKCVSAIYPDPVAAVREAFSTTAGMHLRAEVAHQVYYTIRHTLLDLEKTYPYLYVAPDLDDLVRYLSGNQDTLYNHTPDGTHWDQFAGEWWAEYLSYWGRRLTNIPACRSALEKTRAGGAIDMQGNYDNRIVEHVLSP